MFDVCFSEKTARKISHFTGRRSLQMPTHVGSWKGQWDDDKIKGVIYTICMYNNKKYSVPSPFVR